MFCPGNFKFVQGQEEFIASQSSSRPNAGGSCSSLNRPGVGVQGVSTWGPELGQGGLHAGPPGMDGAAATPAHFHDGSSILSFSVNFYSKPLTFVYFRCLEPEF